MEEYEERWGLRAHRVRRDRRDATAATIAGSQTLLTTRQLELEIEGNQLGNPGVLKATNGNAAKRWKMRQEMWATTRAGKLAEAAIKHIATQKLQTEKERMQEWKQVVMQEVARELHAIRQVHEEAIGEQRYGFQMELGKVRECFQMELEKGREELHQVESHSTMLEYEINTLKGQKQTPEPRLTQHTLATKDAPITPSSIKPPKGKEPISLLPIPDRAELPSRAENEISALKKKTPFERRN